MQFSRYFVMLSQPKKKPKLISYLQHKSSQSEYFSYIIFNHFRLINMLLRLIDNRSAIFLTDRSSRCCMPWRLQCIKALQSPLSVVRRLLEHTVSVFKQLSLNKKVLFKISYM